MHAEYWKMEMHAELWNLCFSAGFDWSQSIKEPVKSLGDPVTQSR